MKKKLVIATGCRNKNKNSLRKGIRPHTSDSGLPVGPDSDLTQTAFKKLRPLIFASVSCIYKTISQCVHSCSSPRPGTSLVGVLVGSPAWIWIRIQIRTDSDAVPDTDLDADPDSYWHRRRCPRTHPCRNHCSRLSAASRDCVYGRICSWSNLSCQSSSYREESKQPRSTRNSRKQGLVSGSDAMPNLH